MSRRHQVKVDTFPFLAVLLCAMGSLILVLLVMDRRSKLAARQRVGEHVQKQGDEYAASLARRKDEFEAKKRKARAAWAGKRDALAARVSAEDKALDAELREVQAQLAAAARKLRAEEEAVAALRGQLKDEKGRVVHQETALGGAREEAKALAGKLSDADKARAKLAGELAQLEAALKAAREAKERDANTHNVVPYNGRRGDARRPLYVECSEKGFLFHPDQLKLDAPSAETLRDEVKKRVASLSAEAAAQGAADARPVMILLVRPRGIERYYEMRGLADAAGVDHSMELVDADWTLAVPGQVTPNPARIASEAPARVTPGVPAALVSRSESVAGQGGSAGTGSPSREGTGLPLPIGSGGPEAGPSLGGPQLGGSPPGSGPAGGSAPPHPDAPVVSMHRPVSRPASDGGPSGLELPVLVPNLQGGGPATAQAPANAGGGQPCQGGAATGGGSLADASGSRCGKFGPPQPAVAPPVPMRPARVSEGGDTMIYVECKPDVVIVYPTRKQIAIESLNHTAPHNPLTQAVNQIIARQQKLARPGEPARFHLKFLYHPGGERTLHPASHALETVSIPKTSLRLMPDDDVRKIIAGY